MALEPAVQHMEVVNLADGTSEVVPCSRLLLEGSEAIAWFQPNLNLALSLSWVTTPIYAPCYTLLLHLVHVGEANV